MDGCPHLQKLLCMWDVDKAITYELTAIIGEVYKMFRTDLLMMLDFNVQTNSLNISCLLLQIHRHFQSRTQVLDHISSSVRNLLFIVYYLELDNQLAYTCIECYQSISSCVFIHNKRIYSSGTKASFQFW